MRNYRIVVALLTTFLIVQPTTFAQDTLTKVGSSVYSGDKLIGYIPEKLGTEEAFYSGWTSEQFNGDNKPFHEIRLAIRRMNKTPGLLKKKLPAFKAEAQAKPYDAIAQFRWVCADWVQHNHKDAPLYEWRNALYRPLSPKTYDYTRLRFIITAEMAQTMGIYASDERLKHLGERLIKIDPKDEFVSYWLRQIKGRTTSVKDKWDNIRYARKLAKAKPKDARAQAILGGAYSNLWMTTRQAAYGKMAIAQYKKYLKLAPKSDSFREDAQFWIDVIPKDQARWDKEKKSH